jgi:hypothetical protein
MIEWRDIPGYPGYQASADGRIRSVDRYVEQMGRWGPLRRLMRGKELSLGHGSNGYLCVLLGRGNPKGVHVLVCLTFHGERPFKHDVRHLNGQRHDNRIENLGWATRKENIADMKAHGTVLRGEKNPQAKITEEIVLAIRALPYRTRGIYEMFPQIGRQQIARIRSGQRWAHIT